MASGSNAVTKTYSRCGLDIASKPRVKDEEGHYFCRPCWQETHSPKQDEVPLDEIEASELPITAPLPTQTISPSVPAASAPYKPDKRRKVNYPQWIVLGILGLLILGGTFIFLKERGFFGPSKAAYTAAIGPLQEKLRQTRTDLQVGMNFNDFAAHCREINREMDTLQRDLSYTDRQRPSYELMAIAAQAYLQSLEVWQANIDAPDKPTIRRSYEDLRKLLWNGAALSIDSADQALARNEDYDKSGEVRQMARQTLQSAGAKKEEIDTSLHNPRIDRSN